MNQSLRGERYHDQRLAPGQTREENVIERSSDSETRYQRGLLWEVSHQPKSVQYPLGFTPRGRGYFSSKGIRLIIFRATWLLFLIEWCSFWVLVNVLYLFPGWSPIEDLTVCNVEFETKLTTVIILSAFWGWSHGQDTINVWPMYLCMNPD